MWGSGMKNGGEGGFMDESYNTSAQTTQRDDAKKDANKAIIPVMIGPLLMEPPQSMPNYDKIQNSILRIVGVVTKIVEATTKLAIEIEDETAKIIAYRWLESDDTTINVKVGQAAVVHAHFRETGEEIPHLFILAIRPVSSYGEYFNHLLEVLLSARNSSNEAASAATDVANETMANGLNPEQAQIFKIIKDVDEDDIGIERSTLKAQVPSLSSAKVDTILDFLVSEGHIYTTRTDDHFKAT
ncbi:replication protein A 32 kDa subunit-like [Fopius arisanus]|uniref:Replication protein A 32 kDa subunit-like n=1 Tax=Fopius arisanus TaxID=64838 RepID=A0A9R1SYE6_9HYME|nr:PREDICTED: replication protein A 32 kDa subunit-like [Fopius arisanus]